VSDKHVSIWVVGCVVSPRVEFEGALGPVAIACGLNLVVDIPEKAGLETMPSDDLGDVVLERHDFLDVSEGATKILHHGGSIQASKAAVVSTRTRAPANQVGELIEGVCLFAIEWRVSGVPRGSSVHRTGIGKLWREREIGFSKAEFVGGRRVESMNIVGRPQMRDRGCIQLRSHGRCPRRPPPNAEVVEVSFVLLGEYDIDAVVFSGIPVTAQAELPTVDWAVVKELVVVTIMSGRIDVGLMGFIQVLEQSEAIGIPVTGRNLSIRKHVLARTTRWAESRPVGRTCTRNLSGIPPF